MENKNLEVIKDEALLAIQSEGKSLADRAEAFIVTDNESLQEANKLFQVCKAFREKIHEHLDPIRESAHKTWKNSIAEIDRREKPFIIVQGIIKPKMITYKLKVEEAIRQKEEEIRAKIEAERRKQEILLKKAADLEKAGELEEADEKFEKAEAAEEKVKETLQNMAGTLEAPKLAGTTIRRIPKWKLIKLADVPREWLKLDEVKVGTQVRATKGKIKIPGIEVYIETV